jgi:hypothetical protein
MFAPLTDSGRKPLLVKALCLSFLLVAGVMFCIALETGNVQQLTRAAGLAGLALLALLSPLSNVCAVTANQLIRRRDASKKAYPVAASTIIYQGTMVFINGDGYADDDTNSGANKFGGIAIAKADNSAGSNGDVWVEVWDDGEFYLTGAGLAQTNVSDKIYASDNYTATLTASGNTYIGRISEYVSSTVVVVDVKKPIDPSDNTVASVADDTDIAFGDGTDAMMLWSTGDASNHALVLALGDTSQALHVTDKGAKATDWNISGTTHPNVYIHSNTTPATDYLRLGDHDGTEADIDVVGGTSLALKLAATEYASVRVTGLAVGTYVAAATPGTDQVTIKSTGTAPASTGADVGHLYADFETDDDELFWLSGTVGTATQLTT